MTFFGKHIIGDGEEKTEAYFLRKMNMFYQMYTGGQTSFGFNGKITNRTSAVRSFAELRAHARSVQNPEKYKPQVDLDKPQKRKKKTINNISWQPVSVLSKFRSIMIDKLMSIMSDPMVFAVDDAATYQREFMKNFMMLLRDPSTSVIRGGVPVDEPIEFEGIETKEDVDALFKMGGIKLAIEVLLKDAIDVTMANSGKQVLFRMIVEDLVDLYCAAIDTTLINGRQILTYVDPAKVIISPSIYPDYRDSEYRGYLSYWSLANIGAIIKDPGKMERVKNVARNYHGTWFAHGSGGQNSGEREDFVSSNTSDGFGVEVLKMYFLDTDQERYVSGIRKNNVRQFEKVSSGFNLSERAEKSGKTIVERNILYLYEVYWVVGTDVVFSTREDNNFVLEGIPRDINNNIIWSMIICNGHEPSLMERCIPFDDDLQIANFRLRRMISKMAPGPRMIIYQNMIADSVVIGGEEFTIFDLIGTYQDEGLLVLNQSKTMAVSPIEEGYGQKPIDFLPSGIAEDFGLLRTRIIDQIDLIRQVTGVNEVADGTTNKGDMLQSVMRGLSEATNSALGPYMMLYSDLSKLIYEHIAYRYQALVLSGSIDVGYLQFGSFVKKVSLDKNIRSHKFIINVSLYTRDMKQMLREYVISRQAELPADAFFVILRAIDDGDIIKAQYLTSKYVAAKQASDHAQRLEISQATAKGNAEAAIATEQAKAQTVQVQLDADIQKMNHEHKLYLDKLRVEHELMMKKAGAIEKQKGENNLNAIEANNRNRLNQ